MAASLLFACGLNEKNLPPFVHISEEAVDGSFLISSILGQRLRISNAAVLLVCLQQNYKNYFHTGMRLGYNTNIFLGKTLHLIDVSSEIAQGGLDSEWLKASSVSAESKNRVCELLLTALREQLYQSKNFTNRTSTTILIDNLSILLNLGASETDLLQFCHELVKLPQEFENLAIVTKMSNCDIYSAVDNNVAKLGNVRIRVIKLKSGVFKEVDGKLLIERDSDDDETMSQDRKCKEVLYKVNDRNIKIFSPGEAGIKA